jgi:glycosyltransferase involved in cell wall biosynthesis
MKILHFIYSLVPGGAERFVIDLTNELAENNDTFLYTLRDDKIGVQGFYVPAISTKVVYRNLKISEGFKPWLAWTFYRILKREKPDVVHCHLNLVNYFFLSSLILHKKVRFIYTVHNSAGTEVLSAIEKALMKFFFKYRFFIPVAISDETKESYKSFYKLNEVDVIYNGRKFEDKSICYNEVLDEISRLKPTKDTLTFCHVARYDEPQKNQKMLVSVFNRLKEEGYDVILLIIGEGFEKATELRAIAYKHIHFLGIKSNVNDYLFSSDAFCLSSNFEGMPISLIEAFGCGCTPVCTPVGGSVNTIINGVTGFLSKSVSEDDYLEVVKQFIKDRKSINKNDLRRYYQENFSIEKCAGLYLNLYCQKKS